MRKQIHVGDFKIGKEEKSAIKGVLDSGRISEGYKTKEFEQEWTKFIGTKYCIVTSSGAGALITALTALKYLYKLENRSKVITTPLTYIADVSALSVVGFEPVFVDLFNFLIGKHIEIKDIYGNSIPVDSKNVIAKDNFSVSIRYSDGSLAVLTYTSLGDEKLPKERMEVFASGKVFIVNDYLSLEAYGVSPEELKVPQGKIKGNRIILSFQDKGLKQELIELGKFMKGEDSRIINFEEVISAMELTFGVHEQVTKSKTL